MGRQSFRLRRDSSAGGDVVGVGSHSRGGSSTQALAGVTSGNQDDDGSIRATDFVIAFQTNLESIIDVTAVSYNEVKLNWLLSEQLTTPALVDPAGLVGLKIVYSFTGYPDAANDGTTVFNVDAINDPLTDYSTYSIFHNVEDAQGRWVYYSLFGHYFEDTGGTGTYWYDKLISMQVLVPTNFGSTDKLWARVPRYYREQDTSGQLYSFISIFGFEIDRNRSLIEAVMTSSDPALAESEGIEQLANLVGLEVNVNDVGVSRTRSLLHDIGYLRRQKGTYTGITSYLRALSGASVDLELVGPDYRITIYAQRANLIADPRFTHGTSYTVLNETGTVTTTAIDNGITIATGASASKVAVISKIAVPVETATNYYMSFNWGEIGGTTAMWGGFILASNTFSAWGSLNDAEPDTTEIPISGLDYVDPSVGLNRRIFDMNVAGTTGNKYPALMMEIPANTTVTIKNWMMEPNNFGVYFDGNSDFGGFLYQSNFSDYQWSGSANVSYSTGTVQRSRTIKAIKKVLPSILPITVSIDVEDSDALRFDWVPGKT